MGDHTETTQIVFDPTVVSYEELLKMFWSDHDATRSSGKQYRSAIFYESETQRECIERSIADEQAKVPAVPVPAWWPPGGRPVAAPAATLVPCPVATRDAMGNADTR